MENSATQPAQDTPNAGVTSVENQPTSTGTALYANAEAQPDQTKKSAEPAAKVEAKVEPAKSAEVPKTVVPEKYDLKLPEGSLLDSSVVEKIAHIAKERGLSNDQAQGLLDAKSEAVAEHTTKQAEALKQISTNEWVTELKSDKEFGGEAFQQNAELAKRVVHKFGSPQFIKTLNDSGLGNHPDLFRFCTRIGKAMSDDQLVLPGTQVSGNKQSMEDIFYGGKTTNN